MTSSPCKAGTDEGNCEITNLHDCLHCGRSINEISRWSEMTRRSRQANINAKKGLVGYGINNMADKIEKYMDRKAAASAIRQRLCVIIVAFPTPITR